MKKTRQNGAVDHDSSRRRDLPPVERVRLPESQPIPASRITRIEIPPSGYNIKKKRHLYKLKLKDLYLPLRQANLSKVSLRRSDPVIAIIAIGMTMVDPGPRYFCFFFIIIDLLGRQH